MSLKNETTPLLLPVASTSGSKETGTGTQASSEANPSATQPHALLGMACVAASAVCFSVMSTLVKFDTYSMTSMEAVFWRSSIAGTLNYVRWLNMLNLLGCVTLLLTLDCDGQLCVYRA